MKLNFYLRGAVLVLSGLTALPASGVEVPSEVRGANLPMQVTTYEAGTFALPIGAHRVPGTSYVVLRQSSKGLGAAVIFGPLGILAVHAAEAHQGKAATEQQASAFDLDMDLETNKVLKSKLVGTEQLLDSTVPIEPQADVIKITPYAWISTYKDGTSRVHIVLETRLPKKGARKKWLGRYIYYSRQSLPLAGDNGWLANDGALIKAVAKEGIDAASQFLLEDIRGSVIRDGNKVSYTAPYMAFAEPVKFDAIVLSKTDETTVLDTSVAWFGVNIFPTHDVSIYSGK